jgi:hypothetical protein
MTGQVVARDFMPPPGAPPKYWCYLTVETDNGRVRIRLHQRKADIAVIGDRVSFVRPGRENKRVSDIQRID